MALPISAPDKIRYLVLESPIGEPLLQMLYEHDESPVWQYLFSDTPWAPYLDESPVVVQTTQDSDLYKWVLKKLKANNEVSGLIIETEENLEFVVNWARARLTVAFDDVRKGLLRFYDPVIWHRLKPRNIGEEGPVRQVIYWYGSALEGRWLISQNPEPVTMAGTPVLEPGQLKRLNLPGSEPSNYQISI